MIDLKNATVIPGRARGRDMGIPTLNINPSDAPKDLLQGVYACWVTVDEQKHRGALHYGPRPVFKDDISLEVHLLDTVLPETPETVSIEIIGRIRDVENFASKEALIERIFEDIKIARGMLTL